MLAYSTRMAGFARQTRCTALEDSLRVQETLSELSLSAESACNCLCGTRQALRIVSPNSMGWLLTQRMYIECNNN